jgi:uncharacterized protein (DUF169 family)
MAPDLHDKGFRALSERLSTVLRPFVPPVAILFHFDSPAEAPRFSAVHPPPNDAGRTGAVPAGCVFWIEGAKRSFSTVAGDHANCNVGSYTHGFLDLATAAKGDDVAAALGAGWIDEATFGELPAIERRPLAVTYGPLSDATRVDVVLLRINGLALMTMKDAFPNLRVEGKPQCHIIPLALKTGAPVASVGCALSRARTGMKSEELVCVLPGSELAEIVVKLEATVVLDREMASYAGQDARRWKAGTQLGAAD